MIKNKTRPSVDIDVKKVAMLARIRLTEQETRDLGPQLTSIMAYIEQLAEVDTDGVTATAHPHDAAMPLRADVVSNTNKRDALQKPAPLTESGLYVVPKVIE
ncbi:MAG: Asp-tRNA(Asn)/Glu-tRNA(Gln) amidotransferase subunit GatC [Mariprofundaceae bacterium]|nr:Asp-tRNA(Asn)/Glu-tRNA(Gln) amidotransferase subunit GatC [Mariprofundaceae bacterium]